MERKEKLFGKNLSELKQIVASLVMPGFTALQIADWLYRKDIVSINEMTNLSVPNREKLNARYEFGLVKNIDVQESKDGTKKYLFPALEGKYIEAAYIPEKTRSTLCLSTQVGCKMGCLFCMTGKQGFKGNLTAAEIVNQVRSLPERNNLTNIVYMGMGEPLDNVEEILKSLDILTSDWGFAMSPRRITVSTIGIIPGLLKFLNNSDAHLAISLHTPFEEERKRLMPVQTVYPIQEVIDHIRKFDWNHQRRISFEYIMFKDINDSERHISELIRLLNGIKCRINLIRFHPIPDTPLHGTEDDKIIWFRDELSRRGITTTIRASRGVDIYAACGLLSTKKLIEQADEDF